MTALKYTPSPTALLFHNDSSFTRAIAGPPGGGKSVACIMELLFVSLRQAPDPDGVRRTRHLICRATYPKLSTTVAKTIREWFPEELGVLKATAPMTAIYKFPLPDGTRVAMELILMALEDEKDVDSLRSLEVTMAFLNESTEFDPAVLRIVSTRVGRYPSAKNGVPCSRSGVLVDFNLPGTSHWLHDRFEVGTPEVAIEMLDGTMFIPTMAFFKQPPAMFCTNMEAAEDGTEAPRFKLNPAAENLQNLRGDYYANQAGILTWQEVRSFLLMEWTDFSKGKLVYGRDFKRSAHVGKIRTMPIRNEPVMIGIDTSGLHPSAVFGQIQAGTLVVMDEIYGEDVAFEQFITDVLNPVIAARYQGCEMLAVCDPSNPRDSRTGVTPVQLLMQYHIRATKAVTNKFSLRREAVSRLLNKRDGLVIDPACKMLVQGFEQGYVFKKIRGTSTSGGQIYSSEADKNEFSHTADALQYLCLPIARVAEEGQGGRKLPKVTKRRVM